MNGCSAVQCRGDHQPSSHRRPDGDGFDAVRPGRPRDRRDADRPHRRRGRRVAAAGVGRRADARHCPAALRGVHLGDLSGVRRARRGHRSRHPAVHGGNRSHSAGHCQRNRIPRAARRRCRARKGRAPRGVAGPRRCRRCVAYPAVGRRRRSGWGSVCARRGRVLGLLHPAHPARRRRGLGYQCSGGVDARRRPGRHRCGRSRRCCPG